MFKIFARIVYKSFCVLQKDTVKCIVTHTMSVTVSRALQTQHTNPIMSQNGENLKSK